ncbi:hypothetical protein M422DRAFT_269021 [Sphaerobolus stellatus SS14]|uniref:Unplaced genomic scaffold SPHSTscaffold_205, whole genome shotgun sequence n=1 Tax=Sphaerobolus stellatus (strain SS14) TaxID=990650 RepID=A0A0C9UW77_SPHS4|nr:hypothetical protein M422DRAFT_269021 [Sphaerobolus stellatus SS14]
MKVTNVTIVEGDAVPGVGGVIKARTGIFVALLQPVQQMGKNREDCRVLITDITQLLQNFNEELKNNITLLDVTTLDSHSLSWLKFERFLEDTKDKLTRQNFDTRRLPKYLRAEEICDIIMGYQMRCSSSRRYKAREYVGYGRTSERIHDKLATIAGQVDPSNRREEDNV